MYLRKYVDQLNTLLIKPLLKDISRVLNVKKPHLSLDKK